ncbi:hypothetical protein H6P81_016554 [Aristolochia fimbriata]|uniref:Spindle and kinetochore-associated protein 3 n=1 Tax=Aristolochia fimbriata TaxID=158543 RepID=A0AAV7E9A9_ARIFI|nr:hypothetical protein H6P81_016554 [Aristolochia fimbriata]
MSAMDEAVSTFCKNLGSFTKQLQSRCNVLKEAVLRQPIPLDSASSTFTQSLDRRITAASADLNFLESMAFGTISFEELLGHCNELYKKNLSNVAEIENHLRPFGYEPDITEFETENDDDVTNPETPAAANSKFLGYDSGLDHLSYASVLSSVKRRLDDEFPLEDSMNLQKLGLSDACLATLASEDNGDLGSPKISLLKPVSCEANQIQKEFLNHAPDVVLSMADTEKLLCVESIEISKDEYDKLPFHLRILASWEDLTEIVEKINIAVHKLDKPKGECLLNQDEIASMELGPKGKSCVLLLLKLNRLLVECADGSVAYRIVHNQH